MSKPKVVRPILSGASLAPQSKITIRCPSGVPAWLTADRAIVLMVFVAAAGLRVWGVGSSLPYVDHVDEPTIVAHSVQVLKTGDLNPHWFLYPSLVIHLHAAIYKLNVIWGTWLGYYASEQSLPDSSYGFALAPDLYTWSRTFTGLLGAATVAGTYLVGRSMLGRGVGLVAAMLLFTSPLHVVNSRVVTPDVLMGTVGLGVLAISWRFTNRPGLRAAIMAGALVGLCAAAKYNGAATASLIGIALLITWRTFRDELGEVGAAGWSPLRWLAVFVGIVLGGITTFLVTNPFVLLDWSNWFDSFNKQVSVYVPVENFSQAWTTFSTQFQVLLESEPILTVSAALGSLFMLFAAIWKHERLVFSRILLLLLPFPLIYISTMSRFQVTHSRNLVVILPFLCLLAGVGVTMLARVLAARVPLSVSQAARARNTTLIAGLVGITLVVSPGREMLNLAEYLAKPDSRNLAFLWIQRQLQSGRRIATELPAWQFCPPAPFKCSLPDVLAGDDLTLHPPDWYAERGYDYVLLTGRRSRLLHERAEAQPERAGTINLYSELPEVAYFNGNLENGKGPHITVLRVGFGLDSFSGVARSGARFADIAELWGYAYAPIASLGDYYDPLSRTGSTGRDTYRPGEAIGLSLYWLALKNGRDAPGDWTVGVLLADDAGGIIQRLDIWPVSNWHVWPVSQWYKNAFLAGVYNVPIPTTILPGTYHLRVTLYDARNGTRIDMPTNPSAVTPTQELEIGTIIVEP